MRPQRTFKYTQSVGNQSVHRPIPAFDQEEETPMLLGNGATTTTIHEPSNWAGIKEIPICYFICPVPLSSSIDISSTSPSASRQIHLLGSSSSICGRRRIISWLRRSRCSTDVLERIVPRLWRRWRKAKSFCYYYLRKELLPIFLFPPFPIVHWQHSLLLLDEGTETTRRMSSFHLTHRTSDRLSAAMDHRTAEEMVSCHEGQQRYILWCGEYLQFSSLYYREDAR